MRTQSRHGFTLIELLVVVAIIALLMGILFPALSGSREMSRRTMCAQHISQIGIALQGYEDANGFYPSGTTNPQGPIYNRPEGQHVSWLVQILPYLDENLTYKHIDQAAGVYDPTNAQVRSLRMTRFLCPSEPAPLPRISASSYAACYNDEKAPIDTDNNGVFFLNSKIRPKDVTDGLSHTIFVGESRLGMKDLGWMSGTRATLRNTGWPLNLTPKDTLGAGTMPSTDPRGSELSVGGFGSAHPGGCQFLFGDGAVHFLENSVSLPILQQMGNRADGKLITEDPTRKGL